MATLPNISGLVARYKASSVDIRGSGVVEWPDLVGSGVLRSRRGSDISLVSRSVNDKPALKFEGGLMVSDSLSLSQPFTAFIVVEVESRDRHPYYLANTSILGDGTSALRLEGLTQATRPRVVLDFGSELISDRKLSSGFRFHTLVASSNPLYSINTSTQGVSGTLGSNGLSGLHVGHPDFYGSIAEILLYDQELDTADRDQVETYLSSEYGLPTDLPVANIDTTEDPIDAGDTVQLDGSGSIDPLSRPLTYRWSFGYPSQNGPTLSPSETASVASFQAGPGVYYVELEVDNGEATDTTTAAIDIADPPYVLPGARSTVTGKALLVGTATLDADPLVEGLDENDITLTGTSTAVVDSSVTYTGTSTILGTATLEAELVSAGGNLAVLSSESTLSASGSLEASGQSTQEGTSSIVVDGGMDRGGQITTTSNATLDATATLEVPGVSTVSGSATLDAVAGVQSEGASTLSGTASVTATGTVETEGPPTVHSGTATLSSEAFMDATEDSTDGAATSSVSVGL